MPLPSGTRYRWKTYPGGKKVRLAFKDNKVIEVKPKGGKAKRVKPKSSDLSSHTDPIAKKALDKIYKK